MQAHLAVRRIPVDQAGFGIDRIIRQVAPQTGQRVRHGRPGLAGLRMAGLIAIAADLVGDPAQQAEIGHLHRQGLTCARHGRSPEGRLLLDRDHRIDQRLLLRSGEFSRQKSKTVRHDKGRAHPFKMGRGQGADHPVCADWQGLSHIKCVCRICDGAEAGLALALAPP